MPIRSICIVGLDDYPLLSGNERGEFPGGGEAVQHALLARAWRDLGLQVSVIVRDHGQPADITIDGIRLIAAYRDGSGVPGIRFIHPRMTQLLRALKRADADVYYQSPAGANTGVTAWFCRRALKPFIFRVASDANCIPGQQLIRLWRDRKLYEYGLRSATLIAAQTQTQQELLRQHYGLGSVIVDMAVEPAERTPDDRKDIDVLWAGNLRDVKRPELLLDIAERLPGLRFTLAGGALPGKRDYYERIAARARTLENVTFTGAVPYQEIGRYFDRARVLVNTSRIEGFPNTFLQAWIRGMPVVSYFDPDHLIARNQLGRTIDSVEDAVHVLAGWLAGDGHARVELDTIGARAREFASGRHAGEQIAGRYLEHLERARGRCRVLHLGPGLEVRGGVAAVERLIIDHLPPAADAPREETAITLRQVATMEEGSVWHKLRVFARARRELRRELKVSAPLIVHIHFASRGSTLRKMWLARLALRHQRPVILHAHGAQFDGFYAGLPRGLRAYVRATLCRADAVIALSSQWQEFFRNVCGVAADRVHVLHNPVAIPLQLPERSGRETVQILFMGRIGRRKGAFDLLRAYEKLPENLKSRVRVVFAGDGEVTHLRASAGHLPNVEVLTWIDTVRRDELLRASDVFALPSYNEGLPMALLEAMAYGLPVISTPVGGIPDVVQPGVEGLLVQPGRIDDLAAALARLVTSPALRFSMGERARARAGRYDVKTYVEQLRALYREVLAARRTDIVTGTAWQPPAVGMLSK